MNKSDTGCVRHDNEKTKLLRDILKDVNGRMTMCTSWKTQCCQNDNSLLLI